MMESYQRLFALYQLNWRQLIHHNFYNIWLQFLSQNAGGSIPNERR